MTAQTLMQHTQPNSPVAQVNRGHKRPTTHVPEMPVDPRKLSRDIDLRYTPLRFQSCRASGRHTCAHDSPLNNSGHHVKLVGFRSTSRHYSPLNTPFP